MTSKDSAVTLSKGFNRMLVSVEFSLLEDVS